MSNKFKSVKKEYWSRRKNNFLNKFKNNNIKPKDDFTTVTERVAFIIDDEVVDVISCQPRLAAILLSEPIILDVNYINVSPGYKYINGEFVPPSEENESE